MDVKVLKLNVKKVLVVTFLRVEFKTVNEVQFLEQVSLM